MTTTETSTEAAFWASINEQPDDGLRRLVFADWLEEQAGTVECERCHGRCVESVYERGEYGPNRYQQDCPTCSGTGRVSNGRAELAKALRATVTFVPWVGVFKLGYGWWCKMKSHHPHRTNEEHLIERPLMDVMSDSVHRCDRDDTVRFDKRDSTVGGVILFATAADAIRDLCRAWLAVNGGA